MTSVPSEGGHLPLLEDLGDLSSRNVLVRLDLNVPLVEDDSGSVAISDDFRIVAALPTLAYLLDQGAKVTVITHLGRPGGQADPRYSIAPVRERLALLGAEVDVRENLRFSAGEKSDDPAFVAQLVEGQDAYVDDAFGVMHRSHASVVGPPRFLDSAAGRLVEREVKAMLPLLYDPPRPFVVVIGGAKVADKFGLLRALIARADRVLVGGGMAFSFLKAIGHEVGDSLVDSVHLEACSELVSCSRDKLLLPTDVVAVAPEIQIEPSAVGGSCEPVDRMTHSGVQIFAGDLPEGWRGLDIGPETAELFASEIAAAGSVVWNGPMGVFEDPRFAAGTYAVADAMATARGRTIIGGGDSSAAVARFGRRFADAMDHISTGGGAALELLEHGDLPGLRALRESWERRHGGDRR
jgi:phosphoglycerate kinase